MNARSSNCAARQPRTRRRGSQEPGGGVDFRSMDAAPDADAEAVVAGSSGLIAGEHQVEQYGRVIPESTDAPHVNIVRPVHLDVGDLGRGERAPAGSLVVQPAKIGSVPPVANAETEGLP